MFAAFFAGCLTATKFVDLEWETLAAGLLAVLAGLFALQAARLQVKHQRDLQNEQNEREAEINRENFLQEMEIFTHELSFSCESTIKYLSDLLRGGSQNPELEKILIRNQMWDAPPVKPSTTDRETSYLYNQIRLKLRHLIKNIEVADGWQSETVEGRTLIVNSIGLAQGIIENCKTFPKSDLVFAQTGNES